MSDKLPKNTPMPTHVPAPTTPGFETLFGLIPLGPVDHSVDKSTVALDTFLKRARQEKEMPTPTPAKG